MLHAPFSALSSAAHYNTTPTSNSSSGYRLSIKFTLGESYSTAIHHWTIAQRTQTVTQSDGDYDLGADVIDVLSMVVRRSGTDYSMDRISRSEYLDIPTKTTESRPTQFFIDRQINPVIKIWPLPENSTDILVFDCLTRIDDADTFTNTMDVPFRFYPCLAAGLAYYIAIKRAPERIQLLKAIYDEEFDRAQAEDRDRASFNVAPNLQYYRVS